jgi:hypothetical protein
MRTRRCIDWLLRVVPLTRAWHVVVGGKRRRREHRRLADLMAEARRLQEEAGSTRT